MKLHWSFPAIFLGISAASAGTDDTRELLRATEVNEYVSLVLRDTEEPAIWYTIDKSGELATEMSLGEELVITSSGQINLTLRYLNPVKYSWSTSEEVEDDPAYVAASRFATAANALFATLSAAQPYSVQKTGERELEGGSQKMNGSGTEASSYQQFYAPELLDWAMWAAQPDNAKCVRGVELVHESESDFYAGEETENRLALQWRKEILAAMRGLVDAAKLAELKAASAQAKTKIDELGKLNEDAAARLKQLKEEADEAVENPKPNEATAARLRKERDDADKALKEAQEKKKKMTEIVELQKAKDEAEKAIEQAAKACSNFARYNRMVLSKYVTAMTEILTAREELLTELGALRERIDGLIKLSGGAPGAEYFKVANIKNESKKLKRVTVTINRRSIALPSEAENGGKLIVTEKDPVTASIKVREHQWLVVEFAPGFAYTGLSYRKYGTAVVNDVTSVTATAEDPGGFVVVGMLNLIPRPLGTGPVWLVAQVGVGSGEPLPLLLGGLGIRLPDVDLSITAGAGFTWIPSPATLKVGDVIASPEVLERDLRYEFRSVPYYVGIQKGF